MKSNTWIIFMNYKKLYFNIIRNRRNNPLPSDEYGETHHIKPRSFGGLDTPNNLIRLSAREHFIVHFLLYKMYKHRVENVFPRSECEKERYKKMTWAFNIMINAKSKLQKRLNKNINNRVFEQLRKAVSAVQIKYPYEFVKTMFDFYINNKLTPSKMDVLNKKFNTSLSDKALKNLFYKYDLKITNYIDCSLFKQKYDKSKVQEMFDFYIQNNLSPKTIDVLNKQFNTSFIYAKLKKLFYNHNLKITDYRDNSLFKQKYSKEIVVEMFNFYVKNRLSSNKMNVLHKQFNNNITYKALKKLFEFHKLKVTEHPEYRHIGQKYSVETIKEMFNFYISNDLSPKTIHVLNKKFNQNLTYSALKKLFYKNNLKIREYQR